MIYFGDFHLGMIDIDLAPIPVVEFEPVRLSNGEIDDYVIISLNRAADDMFDPSVAEPVGQRLFDLYPELRDGILAGVMRSAIEKGELATAAAISSETGNRDGRAYNYSVQPKGDGCLTFIQDVTDIMSERNVAQDHVRIMEAACDDAVHGIAIADNDHRMVYANPALCNMLGYTKEEILQLRIGDMMHAEESEVRYEQADKLLAAEIDQYITDRTYLSKDGEEILMSVAVSTTHGVRGEQLSLAHFRDVREERRAQAELKDALKRAEDATRLKSEFLANMSHEIRTPLNGVIGMAQVLALSDLTKEQAEHLAIIRESSNNLMSLLNDILDLSKVEAGKLDINPTEMDPRHKLNRVLGLYDPIAEDKGIDLSLVIHPGVPSRLKLDPVRLRQCVNNLVSNAIKFTDHGQIVIAVTSKPVGADHELTIHVSDTGVGIAPDKIKRIFNSFQQADGSTTRNYGGTGLGLAISRKLAQLMGGDLTVVSEEGRGSVFTLTLKANAVQLQGSVSGANVREAADYFSSKVGGFAGRRVLVVDDNLINRQVARSMLETYDFEIDEAADGFEAVEKVSEAMFDLILMDIHMPGMGGVAALRKIRAEQPDYEHVPVIALTADAMSGDREKYLAEGMDAYVPKPLEERELITEVGRVLVGGREDGPAQKASA